LPARLNGVVVLAGTKRVREFRVASLPRLISSLGRTPLSALELLKQMGMRRERHGRRVAGLTGDLDDRRPSARSSETNECRRSYGRMAPSSLAARAAGVNTRRHQ